MIVKTISIKSGRHVAAAIRYVLAEHKTAPRDQGAKDRNIDFERYWKSLAREEKELWIKAESTEREYREFKQFKGTPEEYIAMRTNRGRGKPDLGERLQTMLFRQGLKSKDIDGYIREFSELNETRAFRRRDANSAIHHCVSFSDKDTKNLSERDIRDITQRFIHLRAGDSQVIGAVHWDRASGGGCVHVHLIQSGVHLSNSLSTRISQKEFADLKIELEKYVQERHPQLAHSRVRHGKERADMDRGEKIKNYRTLSKAGIYGAVDHVLKASRNEAQFREELGKIGLQPYERAGHLQGVISSETGLKYRFSRMEGIDLSIFHEREQVQEQATKKEKVTEEEIRTEKDIEQPEQSTPAIDMNMRDGVEELNAEPDENDSKETASQEQQQEQENDYDLER